MNCPICRSQMKPLFTGEFCPNDCDRKPKAQFKPLDFAKVMGKLIMEAGYVWAPYIPVMKPIPVHASVDVSKAVMKRYAKCLVRPEYYGKVKVYGDSDV